MVTRVVFLQSAEQDLKELRTYLIKNFGQSAWRDSYSKIKDVVGALKTFPLGGSVPEELQSVNLSQYRQTLSGMNRIIYELRQDTIYIHIICDVRKDLLSLLRDRLLRTL